MFSRHNEALKGTALPEKWITDLKKVINDTYEDQLNKANLSLEIFGEIYPKELGLAFSLTDKSNIQGAAITLFTSSDLEEKTNPEDVLSQVINSSSEFFELIFNGFAENDESIYQARWEKTDLKGHNFYYRISRENIGLTILANKLLEE